MVAADEEELDHLPADESELAEETGAEPLEEVEADERDDVGPDPVWGLGAFVVGLLVMGFGGSTDRHWVFNVGSGILLLGAIAFLTAVALTSLKQDPPDVSITGTMKKLRSLLRNE